MYATSQGRSAWELVETGEEWLHSEDVEAWGPVELEIRQFVRYGLLDTVDDPDVTHQGQDDPMDAPPINIVGQEDAGADGGADMGAGEVGMTNEDDYRMIEDSAQGGGTSHYMEEEEGENVNVGGVQVPMLDEEGWQVIRGQN